MTFTGTGTLDDRRGDRHRQHRRQHDRLQQSFRPRRIEHLGNLVQRRAASLFNSTATVATADSHQLTSDAAGGEITFGGIKTCFRAPTSLLTTGSGTTLLTAANTYSGATSVDSGTLLLGAANGVGTASAVTVGLGATFNLANNNDAVGSIAGAVKHISPLGQWPRWILALGTNNTLDHLFPRGHFRDGQPDPERQRDADPDRDEHLLGQHQRRCRNRRDHERLLPRDLDRHRQRRGGRDAADDDEPFRHHRAGRAEQPGSLNSTMAAPPPAVLSNTERCRRCRPGRATFTLDGNAKISSGASDLLYIGSLVNSNTLEPRDQQPRPSRPRAPGRSPPTRIQKATSTPPTSWSIPRSRAPAASL